MDAVAIDSETTVSAPIVHPGRFVRPTLLVGAGLAVLIGLLVGLAVARGSQMSPFDEGTHADYAYQVSHGHIPYAGSLSAPQITREAACHGSAVKPLHPPLPCGTPNPPLGQNYNFAHPPLYYTVTGMIARGLDGMVGGEHFITMARLVGALWLWAGAMVLFLALRLFGVPWPYAGIAVALVPLAPGVLHASSTVTNDAAAVLSGALAIYVLARIIVKGRMGWLLPAVITLGVTATKVINVLPMLAVAVTTLVLAVGAWRGADRQRARSLVLTTVGIGVGFLVVYKGWALFQAGRAVPNYVSPILGVTGRPVVGRPVGEMLTGGFTGVNLISGYFLQAPIDGHLVRLWSRALNIVVFTAPLMALAAWARRSAGWVVAAMTFGGLLLYPLIVEIQVYLDSRMYFPRINPRYGMSFVPCAVACLALVAWKRGALRLSGIGLGIGVFAMLVTVGGLIN